MITINTEGFTDEELKGFGLSRTTIWRARKRGWARIRYHGRVVPQPDASRFDAGEAYELAEHVYAATPVHPLKYLWRNELIQEAVTQMYDYSGRSTDRPYQWTIAKTAMTRHAAYMNPRTLSYLATLAPVNDDAIEFEDDALVLEQIKDLVGEALFSAALTGNQEAVEAIRGKVWN